MLGYSEANAIYFSCGDKTGFAKIKSDFSNLEIEALGKDHFESMVESGSFKGFPKFKYIKDKLCKLTKQCHSAEHKTYNAFQKKITKLKRNTQLQEFYKYIPSLEEIRRQSHYSVFCGTSFIFSSSAAIIIACLPNLISFHNTNLVFMLSWLTLCIFGLFALSYLIQSRYLAKPNALQIFIAQKALKEVLNGNNHKPNS
jgi:hypothetical protein